jgi:hypothetical protein
MGYKLLLKEKLDEGTTAVQLTAPLKEFKSDRCCIEALDGHVLPYHAPSRG